MSKLFNQMMGLTNYNNIMIARSAQINYHWV
jgi:hypothetical protein